LFCRFLGLVLLVVAAMAGARAADAAPTSSLDLRADVVDYYGNRFIVTGDGNVRVRFSDGTVATGETFAMDLKLNRFVVAGNVHLDGRNVHQTAAAYAGYLDLDRLYLLTEGGEPDRYTYFGQDYSDAHKGREQPGDVFSLPDVSRERPFAIARHMSIIPKTLISMQGPRIYTYGVWTPLPSYVVNFSANPNWYQNGFSGAVADLGVPFYASRDSMSTIHVRYDQVRGLYTSFDEHFVWNRDYAVFSVNPLTQDQRQFNFIGYKRESPDLETRVFYQLSLLSQFPLSEPSSASSYGNFAINTAFARHAIGLSIDQWNNSLLATTNNGITTTGLRVDGHPYDMQISIQSYENEWRFWRHLGLPIKFQYRFGGGYTYDSYGVSTLNPILDLNGEFSWLGFVYPKIWQHFVGLTVYTPSITIGKQVSIALKSDKQRQWFSLPHYVDSTTSSATIARTPLTPKQPSVYLSYSVTNVGDYYGGNQRIAYPPFANPYTAPDGTVYTGLDAFRGIATARSWTGGFVYAPNPNFALNMILQRFYDTPAPVPFLGGLPPWELSADVRVRLSKTILLDLSRSYYFNWADQKWSPQYGIQISP
jgi:hypothetical protein